MCHDDIAHLADHVVLLSAMANRKRLHILTLLQHSELSVNNLAETVGISQSAISQHLSKLRQHRLVSTRRNAQTIYYYSNDERVAKILRTLAALNTG